MHSQNNMRRNTLSCQHLVTEIRLRCAESRGEKVFGLVRATTQTRVVDPLENGGLPFPSWSGTLGLSRSGGRHASASW